MAGEIQKTESPPAPMTPQLFERFLENQAKELELKAKELTLQQQKDNNAFAFGREALTAKSIDRKDQRAHEKSVRKMTFLFVGFIILLLVALISYALYSDKDEFATELIKALVYLFSGGAGGYGYAKARQNKTATDLKSKSDS